MCWSRARRKWAEFFNLYVMGVGGAIRFHKLDRLDRVFFVRADTNRTFAVAFRIGSRSNTSTAPAGQVGLSTYMDAGPHRRGLPVPDHSDLDGDLGRRVRACDGVLYITILWRLSAGVFGSAGIAPNW